MTTSLSIDNQQFLAGLTRKQIAKHLDTAQDLAELLVDLARQAAARRAAPGDMLTAEPEFTAVRSLAAAIDSAVAAAGRALPDLYCPHGWPDKEACAEGGHDQ